MQIIPERDGRTNTKCNQKPMEKATGLKRNKKRRMGLGRDKSKRVDRKTMIFRPKYIIIHHSETQDSGTVSWQAIRRYHIETKKWQDIGYHWGIELVNNEYEVLVGRPMTRPGAHCGGMNYDSFGICCVGNYDIQPPNIGMLETLSQRLLIPLIRILNIPIENIKGHRDFTTKKTCPGTKFDLDLLRRIVSRDVNG